MTPIDILIKSKLDKEGFEGSKKLVEELGEAVKVGFGINIGEKIAEAIEEIPAKLKEAAAEGIKFNEVIQDENARFQTLLGSIDEAANRVQELVEFSDANPIFSLQEVANADAFLQVVTKGGLAGKEALKLIGDAAAAGHVPIDQMAEVIGRLYAGLEEGLPVEHATMRLLQMGLISGDTAKRLNDMAANGYGMGRAMEVIESTFSKTTGAMEKQSQTLSGEFKALKSNIESVAGAFTKTWAEAMQSALASVNKFLGSEEMKRMLAAAQAAGHHASGEELAAAALGQWLGGASVGGNTSAAIGGKAIGFGNLNLAAAAGVLAEKESKPESARPLTESQKQAFEEAQKGLTGALRDGMTEREKLEDEYAQRVMEVETALGANQQAMHEALLNVEEEFGRRRVLLKAQQDEEAEKNTEETLKREKDYRIELQRQEMQADKDALRIRMDDLSLASAKLDADFTHTEVEKRQARIKLIQDEIAAIDTLIEKLTKERDLESDPAAKQALNQQITGLAGDKRNAAAKLVPFTDGLNPESFADQWSKSLTQLRDEWGTLASQIGDTFRTNVNSAISSTSSELARAIVLTADFDAALKNIAITILTDIIQAIIQMGIRWIVTQIMMSIAGKSIQAGMVAANAPIAAASAALWATPATLATIASYGEAAAAAPEFIFAAEAATMAGSLVGFKDGGYTGDGDPGSVAGLAHKGEFYFTAPQTRAIGRGNLARLAQTVGSGSSGIGASIGAGMSGGGRVDNSVKIAPVMHPDMVKQWAQSESGKKFIVDIARGVVLEMQS